MSSKGQIVSEEGKRVSGGAESESTTVAVAVAVAAKKQQMEVELAKCACCGFTEECTLSYIAKVRDKYDGRWICGLCAEAVKDEIFRSDDDEDSIEQALKRHINFCNKFRSSTPPANPTHLLISAMKHVLRRSLDSPRSTPSSPLRKEDEVHNRPLVRSESCFSTLAS